MSVNDTNIYLATLLLGKYPLLLTSTLVDNS